MRSSSRFAVRAWLPAVSLGVSVAAGGLSLRAEDAFGSVLSIPTVAALRAARLPSPAPSVVLVSGYYAPGDGGGGVYYPKPGGPEADDGGAVIVAADQTRYIADPASLSDLRHWGARPGTRSAVKQNSAIIPYAIKHNQGLNQPTTVHGQYFIDQPILLAGNGWAVEGGARQGGGVSQDGFVQLNPEADIFQIKGSRPGTLRNLRLSGDMKNPDYHGAAITVLGSSAQCNFEDLWITFMGVGIRLPGKTDFSLSTLRGITIQSCHSGLSFEDASHFYNNTIGPLEVFDADEKPIWVGGGTQNTWIAIHMANQRTYFAGKTVQGMYEAGARLIRVSEADLVNFNVGRFVQSEAGNPRRITKITRDGLEIEQPWTSSWTNELMLIVKPASDVMFHAGMPQQTIAGINIEWHSASSCISGGEGGDMSITSIHIEGWCPIRPRSSAYLLNVNATVGSMEVANTILDAGVVGSVGLAGNAASVSIGDLDFFDIENYGQVHVAPILAPQARSNPRVNIQRIKFRTGAGEWWQDEPLDTTYPYAVERVGATEYVSHQGEALALTTSKLINDHGSWSAGDKQIVRQGEALATYVCLPPGGTYGAGFPAGVKAWVRSGIPFAYLTAIDGLYPREWITIGGHQVRISRLPSKGLVAAGAVKLGAASAPGATSLQTAGGNTAGKFGFGDPLVLGVGTPNEEFAHVVRVTDGNRLYLDRALSKAHPADETLGTAVGLDRVLGGSEALADAPVTFTAPRFAPVAADK